MPETGEQRELMEAVKALAASVGERSPTPRECQDRETRGGGCQSLGGWPLLHPRSPRRRPRVGTVRGLHGAPPRDSRDAPVGGERPPSAAGGCEDSCRTRLGAGSPTGGPPSSWGHDPWLSLLLTQ